MDYKVREKWIDNAKGIAIVLVILAHVDAIWSFAHGFHLVVFFILSGYTFKVGPITNEFLEKKFSRLMTPFFYTCFAVMAMDAINSYCILKQRSIVDITAVVSNDLIRSFFASGTITQFGSYDVGSRIGAIWFLPALFFGITIFRVLSHLINKDLNLILSTVVVAIIAYISTEFIWLPFSVQSGMFATPFICVGYLMKKNKLLHHIRVYYYFVALIILLLGIKFEFCRLYFVSVSMPDILLSPLAGLSGFIIVYLISLKYSGPILDYLGQISLTIMCVHLFALETMGVYFNHFLDIIDVTGIVRVACGDIIQVLFALIGAVIVEIAKNRFVNHREELINNQTNEIVDRNDRDSSIDVAKGMLVISIFVGLFAIDEQLKTIFYSCNMIAFIFFSGYFYDSERSAKDSLLRMTKTLIAPYLVAVAILLLQSCRNWNADFFVSTAIKYGLGLSSSKELFSEIETVGPIFFLLFLFVLRLLYLLVDHIIISEIAKWMVVALISLIGVVCGIQGYWLPWSIDVACYALIIYKVGIAGRRCNVLSKLNHSKYFYFVLSPLWAYMIYSGSMVIAMRNYGNYGLAILGSIAGVAAVWLLANYIAENLSILKYLFTIVGKASIYLLIIYTVLGEWLNDILSVQFNAEGMPYLFSSMLIQIIIAVLGFAFVNGLRNKLIQ